jgi:cellulose synthase operon protein C
MRTALAALGAALVLATGPVANAESAAESADQARKLADEAKKLHEQAQKDHDAQKYERAHQLYQEYLRRYAADAAAAEIGYFDAELQFARQRYDDAARLYDLSISRDAKGKYAERAAYGMVIAAKEAAHLDDRKVPDAGAPCPPPPTVCPVTPSLQRLLTAFDRYLAVVQGGDERPTIEYRRARIYYELNQFDKAAPLFDAIMTRYPDTELAVYSANLEMDCLAVLKRYDALRALVARVKQSPALMKDATTREQVEHMVEGLKKKP